MPLIRPEIQKVLRAAGLDSSSPPRDGETIIDKLDQAGLTDTAIAEALTEIALHDGSSSLRKAAIDTALKVKGALKETPPQIPSFTIILQPAAADSPIPATNPILFPRQSLAPSRLAAEQKEQKIEELKKELN